MEPFMQKGSSMASWSTFIFKSVLNQCFGMSLIINLKAVGMIKTMWYTHNPPQKMDRINYNSITEICEINFYLFFSALEIAVSKCHGLFRFFMYGP